VLDISMPGMNGLEVATCISNAGSNPREPPAGIDEYTGARERDRRNLEIRSTPSSGTTVELRVPTSIIRSVVP
jgi:CheY-like chemotaxis protein